ncbi:glutaredoxin family protein [Vibrio hippocampi]|uniref:Glutaredoxin domain-containing protein n=1 Tax=Vibrio hippocampi TaxID=654686 RepID=A0ABM8ZLA0_9VIBR|nr:glutaredoxin domain-containing protein [Vibrio hippocampi]CAH0529074.1 hypothetical protein VHP8226_03037 [Vibrio hippocampi]
MKLIRIFLGKVILLVNSLFSPKGVTRTDEAQAAADSKAKQLALYQFEGCPFCVKVRRELKRQSINVTLKDAANDPQARSELLAGGGKVKVPCLQIKDGEHTQWMYESSDIVNYLKQEFA